MVAMIRTEKLKIYHDREMLLFLRILLYPLHHGELNGKNLIM